MELLFGDSGENHPGIQVENSAMGNNESYQVWEESLLLKALVGCRAFLGSKINLHI